MSYWKLKEMREKCNDNVTLACCGIFVFYFIALIMLVIGAILFTPGPFLIQEILRVIVIVFLVLIASVILGALRIHLYLTDEMKKARIKETGIPY